MEDRIICQTKRGVLFIVTFDSPLNQQIKNAVTRESANLANVKASVRSIRYENGKQAEKKVAETSFHQCAAKQPVIQKSGLVFGDDRPFRKNGRQLAV